MRDNEAAWNVVVVDDAPENLRLLATMLAEQGCVVRPFTDGETALRAVRKQAPDVVLLDVNMPGLSGYDVCRRLKADAATADLPVLFISALHDVEAKVRAFEAGGLDYITKPFRLEEVHARVRTHVHLHRLEQRQAEYSRNLESVVAEQVREISEAQLATIVALARLAESRDDDTDSHIERVQGYCRLLGHALMSRRADLDAHTVTLVHHASPLHDIGKVGIPDAVLLKPGALDLAEREIMKGHAAIGAGTLARVCESYPRNEFLHVGRDLAHCHHERWDGRGYPRGLAGDAIPLSARIIAVADVYDALRSRRPYKEPWPHERAVATIAAESGRQFDPGVVGAFLEVQSDLAAIRAMLTD